ncbi:uncharacterized protein LTR77_002275 [Saxophila tyrrhenica]|uniref:Uncharacterized protein n=1 Tax=Saxophila tyrrhenica TaxID=1690608 RepID=A0AAV9PI52_9PEZI|nr:hypothetical protein LTR77_002275 [Saxophila tyrrhenica]
MAQPHSTITKSEPCGSNGRRVTIVHMSEDHFSVQASPPPPPQPSTYLQLPEGDRSRRPTAIHEPSSCFFARRVCEEEVQSPMYLHYPPSGVRTSSVALTPPSPVLSASEPGTAPLQSLSISPRPSCYDREESQPLCLDPQLSATTPGQSPVQRPTNPPNPTCASGEAAQPPKRLRRCTPPLAPVRQPSPKEVREHARQCRRRVWEAKRSIWGWRKVPDWRAQPVLVFSDDEEDEEGKEEEDASDESSESDEDSSSDEESDAEGGEVMEDAASPRRESQTSWDDIWSRPQGAKRKREDKPRGESWQEGGMSDVAWAELWSGRPKPKRKCEDQAKVEGWRGEGEDEMDWEGDSTFDYFGRSGAERYM